MKSDGADIGDILLRGALPKGGSSNYSGGGWHWLVQFCILTINLGEALRSGKLKRRAGMLIQLDKDKYRQGVTDRIKMTCSSSGSWPEGGWCKNHCKVAPRLGPYLREYIIDILRSIKIMQLLMTGPMEASIMGTEVTTTQEIRKEHCHMQQTDPLGRVIRKGPSQDPRR